MPAVWETDDHVPTSRPIPDLRGVNKAIRSNGRLRITPDLDVLAWLGEQWTTAEEGRRDKDGFVWLTAWELASALYGTSKPPGWDAGGEEYRQIHAALSRLRSIQVTIGDWDAQLGQVVSGAQTFSSFVLEWTNDDRLAEARGDAAIIGGLRGKTLKVRLPNWLTASLDAGAFTYLRWEQLRKLRRTAKRVWVYLEAEQLTPEGTKDRLATSIDLAQPALDTLGVGGYARHIDARRALKRAAKRIMKVDRSWESIEVWRRGKGDWKLHAVKRRGPLLAEALDVQAQADLSMMQARQSR